jgi:hypothetical protein
MFAALYQIATTGSATMLFGGCKRMVDEQVYFDWVANLSVTTNVTEITVTRRNLSLSVTIKNDGEPKAKVAIEYRIR